MLKKLLSKKILITLFHPNLIFHWKFIASMACAVISRFSFILINNSLLKIPSLAENSTTITSFITAIGFIFIMIANYLFLNERITVQQGVGALIILLGMGIMLR